MTTRSPAALSIAFPWIMGDSLSWQTLRLIKSVPGREATCRRKVCPVFGGASPELLWTQHRRQTGGRNNRRWERVGVSQPWCQTALKVCSSRESRRWAAGHDSRSQAVVYAQEEAMWSAPDWCIWNPSPSTMRALSLLCAIVALWDPALSDRHCPDLVVDRCHCSAERSKELSRQRVLFKVVCSDVDLMDTLPPSFLPNRTVSL